MIAYCSGLPLKYALVDALGQAGAMDQFVSASSQDGVDQTWSLHAISRHLFLSLSLSPSLSLALALDQYRRHNASWHHGIKPAYNTIATRIE